MQNNGLTPNVSPARRAWAQSSFRTPRSDKAQFYTNSPLRRVASMTASDNETYIKTMEGCIQDFRQKSSGIPTKTVASSKGAAPVVFQKPQQPAISIKLPDEECCDDKSSKQQTKDDVYEGPWGVAAWGSSFERLLEDPAGMQTFAEFLKKEFSAENIYFWTACERMRQTADEAERAGMAKIIYNKHLAGTALEPVNVDSQARNLSEERLQSGDANIFAAAQKQIFNLMKFDSYPRFIRSDLYRTCVEAEEKQQPLPYSGEDLDELLRTQAHLMQAAANGGANGSTKVRWRGVFKLFPF